MTVDKRGLKRILKSGISSLLTSTKKLYFSLDRKYAISYSFPSLKKVEQFELDNFFSIVIEVDAKKIGKYNPKNPLGHRTTRYLESVPLEWIKGIFVLKKQFYSAMNSFIKIYP